ncbi:protein of unknown function [Taphrina deformans PYCC 5710]|uniref:Sister chromatid cohesion acetyltransferase Eco1 n=1 Tax=Taphrina deformans (strain PYCC 5710 / ATCC 11124 / CBS 356.35 / IMI 108563 / JCM 9778 / NBRC 8474) TaxID=1097556 RepID=R4XHG2_TAPDE|nr:protein of unknown function [Taphrina deformans PYCC 5710]|eukprot:CCG83968.1 protein of unknown function [Taphrina deformans PYCC 5710]
MPDTPIKKKVKVEATSRSITALLQRSHNPITKRPKGRPKSTAVEKSKGKELVQMHLNLLPAHVTCKECGMSYTRTSPPDVSLHTSFHSSHLLGLSLSSTLHLPPGIHRLSCTKQNERNMIQKCCELVDLELSASLSPLTNQFSAYIQVHQNRIRSFIVVQPISRARTLLPDGDLSVAEVKADMGVNRMWTSRTGRGRGLVLGLLDHAVRAFVNGCRLDKSTVAFTQLSESGQRAVEKWLAGGEILVYAD